MGLHAATCTQKTIAEVGLSHAGTPGERGYSTRDTATSCMHVKVDQMPGRVAHEPQGDELDQGIIQPFWHFDEFEAQVFADVQDAFNKTALHVAAGLNFVDGVKALLKVPSSCSSRSVRRKLICDCGR